MTAVPTLDLMTLNAWGLPFPAAWWRRGPRFARIRDLLASGAHDVVGLQEVWGGARALLQADDLHWPGAGGDTGLGAHTSHPVIARFEHRFRRAVGMDRLVRKGLLALHLELPAGRVWVLVTHLQAGASAAEMAVRGEQVAEQVGVLDDQACGGELSDHLALAARVGMG